MTDTIGHMERETSVGGEKQGQIMSKRGRWRKALGMSKRGAVITHLSSF